MKVNSDWYNGIEKQIELLKDSLSEKDYKRYKLRLLLCAAKRVTEFSSNCRQCQMFQQDVTTLAQDAGNVLQMTDKERHKSYFKSLNRIIGHLQGQHRLITKRYYIALWMVLGTGLFLFIGPIGIPIGAAIGAAIGVALDAKARKEGRVLCPR